MNQRPRPKALRLVAATALGLSLLLPAAAPVAAADPVVLTVGTTQDLDSTNPFNTYLVTGYEVFQLTYDLLTNFELDTSPGPGFADTWERSPDKVTYHIRDGMKWSDGTPATSKDVCYSWGLAMAAIADGANVGAGTWTRTSRMPASPRSSARTTARSSPTRRTSRTGSSRCTCRSFPSTSTARSTTRRWRTRSSTAPLVGTGPVHPRRMEDRPVRPVRAQPQLLGPAGLRGRGRDPVLPRQRRRDVPGAQERASWTTRTT